MGRITLSENDNLVIKNTVLANPGFSNSEIVDGLKLAKENGDYAGRVPSRDTVRRIGNNSKIVKDDNFGIILDPSVKKAKFGSHHLKKYWQNKANEAKWTCDVCMIQNVSSKCASCETPNPNASSDSAQPSAQPPTFKFESSTTDSPAKSAEKFSFGTPTTSNSVKKNDETGDPDLSFSTDEDIEECNAYDKKISLLEKQNKEKDELISVKDKKISELREKLRILESLNVGIAKEVQAVQENFTIDSPIKTASCPSKEVQAVQENFTIESPETASRPSTSFEHLSPKSRQKKFPTTWTKSSNDQKSGK